MKQPNISTLGELKKAGYSYLSIKDEIRNNLLEKLKSKAPLFDSVYGYEQSVLPEVERALLSKHHILFLGLRGQAKTMMARQMCKLLNEYIPVVAGSPIHDDPFKPVSPFAKNLIEKEGDLTGITWLHRNDRYAEKLATPDVNVADLIGDIDPIKAAGQKLSLSDEKVIHYGMIPRNNRGIFVINELPDLQPRIQVALFNILQEGDVQIRGFNLRLPLDIQFVFTANPEDYTNRGSIVTPLKDRIGSQILTHYLNAPEQASKITASQVKLSEAQKSIRVPDLLKTLVELVAVEARKSEFVDAKSGVSARLSISAYENLVSAAELRFLKTGQPYSFARIADLYACIPAINGKIELVYEGEQEGPAVIAYNLISMAIRNYFVRLFPDPSKLKRKTEKNPYSEIVNWFSGGQRIDLLEQQNDKVYAAALSLVNGLSELVEKYQPQLKGEEKNLMMEFVLHALAEHSLLNKNKLAEGIGFSDLFGALLNPNLDSGKSEN